MAAGRRKVYLDALRILAMLLVIFNHLPGYTLFQISSGLKGWAYTFITMFTRINVPIFFMISGALLLGKQESYSAIWKNRILKTVLVLTLFSALCFSLAKYPDVQFDLKKFLQKLTAGSVSTPYWFMYAYIAFLMMLPFLRKVADGFTRKDFFYLLVIRFVRIGLVPAIDYVMTLLYEHPVRLSSDFRILFMTERVFFYPLMGYYLDQVLDITKIKAKHLWGLFAVVVFSLVVPSAITIHQGENGGFTQEYVQMFDYLIAICVFVATKYFFTRKQSDGTGIVEKCICAIGPLTLGIYLLDPILRKIFYNRAWKLLDPLMPTIIASACWCIFSAVLGGLITFILRKIPGLKKIL